MRDLVRGYAAATFETVGSTDGRARIAAELAEFATAIVNFPELRQALTDATVEPAVRRAVVVDLLEGKASPETVGLVGFTAYYERASELAPTIAGLITLAEQAPVGTGGEVVEPPAGRSVARERLRGYSERIFEELADRADLDRVEDELFDIARLLDAHDDLRRVLADPSIDYVARAGVLSDLLGERVFPATLRLARYVLRAGRTRDLVGTFEWLVELAARERGRRVAEVRSAVALDATETDRLANALGRLVHRTVEVRVILDPSVVGGILVSVGDLVIDGTVRLRFERLRDLLVQPS
ncbi:MAG: synthase, delta subunit [Acidimicrobiaceae bacterium]|jgi:F-type H+-transporting ATPase subunit delta|nr:synthase, delta subunit [Acidimicrobiaceae bacterium]